MALSVHVFKCTTDPTVAPTDIGQHFVNTTTGDMFFSIGTSSIADWIKVQPGDLAADMACVQARRTTDFSLTTGFTDIDLDTTDIENFSGQLDHDDVNRDRITFKIAGKYRVWYGGSVDYNASATVDFKVLKNDTTLVPGSDQTLVNSNDEHEMSRSFIIDATVDDFISLQGKTSATSVAVRANLQMNVFRLRGTKGDKGDTGAGSTVTIKDEGTSVTGTPHSALDFVGAGVTATDAGAGVATITIPGGGLTSIENAQASATSTQTLTSSTFTKLTGTTTFISSTDFDDDSGTAMRIKYIGTGTVKVLVNYQAKYQSIDTSKAAGNLQVHKNGVAESASVVSGHADTSVTPDSAAGSFIVSMTTSDFIEIFGNRESGAQNIDVKEIVLGAVKLG